MLLFFMCRHHLLTAHILSEVSELDQMTPSIAAFYSFTTRHAHPVPRNTQEICEAQEEHELSLGPYAALQELKSIGCSLANESWVKNHWGLILWKLAGMVALDPETETDYTRKRWCWREVINQLLYRCVCLAFDSAYTLMFLSTGMNVNSIVERGLCLDSTLR